MIPPSKRRPFSARERKTRRATSPIKLPAGSQLEEEEENEREKKSLDFQVKDLKPIHT